MSYFAPFISTRDRSFLLIMNTNREVGLAVLDKEGRPTTWAFGDIPDVLQDGFRETNPGAVVVLPEKGSLAEATNYVLSDDDTVEELLEVLNGEPSEKRGMLLSLESLGMLSEFVGYEYQEHRRVFVARKQDEDPTDITKA